MTWHGIAWRGHSPRSIFLFGRVTAQHSIPGVAQAKPERDRNAILSPLLNMILSRALRTVACGQETTYAVYHKRILAISQRIVPDITAAINISMRF
ncbi:hypothetical protein F5Y14DRAFT_345349 [Nemania sp. NC0429]|nr:hypothetical protein F5Y14DRAFT_345349 [Nemania sp. NC0429]